MPILKCAKCGHDRFAVELRRVEVGVGDASCSLRVPAQVCLECGLAAVDIYYKVEQRPLPEQESKPDGDDQGAG